MILEINIKRIEYVAVTEDDVKHLEIEEHVEIKGTIQTIQMRWLLNIEEYDNTRGNQE